MKTATKNSKMLLMSVVVMFGSAPVFAGNFRIIANPSVKAETVSAAEIKAFFSESGIRSATGRMSSRCS